MSRQIISVPNAPKMPFSPAIKTGQYLFVSGQAGFYNPKTGQEVKGIEAQTKQTLENIKEVLEAADSSLPDVVKATVFLRNADDFGKMNEVYADFFPKDYPARSTVIVGLALPQMLIEIECIAYCPSKE
jgi:2-iminobutanoate/2-iminopropanoate deaminase